MEKTMNLQKTLSATTQIHPAAGQGLAAFARQLGQYFVWASLGVIGGGLGVAIIIGLTVVIQQLFYAPMALLPDTILLTIAAVLVGLAASWLLSRAARAFWPSFRYSLTTHGLQVILVSSALTSLLENYLFMHNLTALTVPMDVVWANLTFILSASV
jgi:hypothetical protein